MFTKKRFMTARYAYSEIKAKYIILHHTGTLRDCSSYLASPCDGRKVSIHFHINRKGVVTQYTNLIQLGEKRVWKAAHAGVSFYKGVSDFNNRSIGIEMDGDGKVPFTAQQYEALRSLVRELMEVFDIPKANILLHREIAPRRKNDPNPFNKMEFLNSL